jgi:uncharacterized membrane protein (DUF2068 family)
MNVPSAPMKYGRRRGMGFSMLTSMNQPRSRTTSRPLEPVRRPHFEPLRWIGTYKLLKGLLSLTAALMVLRLLHSDLPEVAIHFLERLGIDPASRFGTFVLKKVLALHARNLIWVATALFGYTVLSAFEGFGLLLRRAWAEWLTAATSGTMIPLEIWECGRHFTWIRLAIVLLNVAVVVYLIWRIRRDRKRRAVLIESGTPAAKQEGRRQQAEESHR